MADILGVVYEVPVPNELPPEDAAYQLIVPELAVALKATVPVPQRELPVTPVIVGVAFTVMLTTLVVLPHWLFTVIV